MRPQLRAAYESGRSQVRLKVAQVPLVDMQPPRRSRATTFLVLLASLLVAAAAASIGIAHGHGSSTALTAKTATRPIDTGVVIVETDLGYQDGAAAGTGMVLTSSGEVLTNNHVIEGATSVRVVVPQSGRTYDARVVGYDVTHDTAVLQLSGASGLATVTTGDSSALTVGQPVRAIGNAGGTGSLTTAAGTVTGLGKSIAAATENGAPEQLTGLVETNAQLQPGDSGGPLVDSAGRVVGMYTAASSGGFRPGFSNTSAGSSYAIPIDTALAIADQIESGQSSDTVHVGGTGFLGVNVSESHDGSGAVVAGVVSGGPADSAGLGVGDTITAVDGQAVDSPTALRAALQGKSPGDEVSVDWTDSYGSQHSATIALGSGPPQ
jgi:S1-C subfamily serine protease